MQFTVTSTDFFGNNVRSYDIVNRLQFGLWISGYNRQIWNAFIAPTAANAFYEVNFNQICKLSYCNHMHTLFH